jgi:hypothetical protein
MRAIGKGELWGKSPPSSPHRFFTEKMKNLLASVGKLLMINKTIINQ